MSLADYFGVRKVHSFAAKDTEVLAKKLCAAPPKAEHKAKYQKRLNDVIRLGMVLAYLRTTPEESRTQTEIKRNVACSFHHVKESIRTMEKLRLIAVVTKQIERRTGFPMTCTAYLLTSKGLDYECVKQD